MAPKFRDQNPSGLGRAIINKKAKDARRQQESGLYVTDTDPISRLKSVTQERDLDEFLNTAQLAGTEFTAERRNVKVIPQVTVVSHNPFLLSEQEEQRTLKRQEENRTRLRVPRRPPWTKAMTPAMLDRQEKDAFLSWRRDLAELQDKENFFLTPFERNLEVWRQLWRVLERSHLVVQIVDARNPLRFRCDDIEKYVKDVEGTEGEKGSGEGKRRSLLLINKADLLTSQQRIHWANYFDEQNIQYAFYSAANASAIQAARLSSLEAASQENNEPRSNNENDPPSPVEAHLDDDEDTSSEEETDSEAGYYSVDEDPEEQDPRARVLSVVELEDLFLSVAPPLTDFADVEGTPPKKLSVGLVGYPNVGKSSTINSLLGEKKVSVSSTPGKTKHFQTIHLSDTIVLCDCPGLVFPQFATTKADLICDGVLPIDQMREYTGPVALLVKRIPGSILEATYGLTIKTRSIGEGGDGQVTAENLLVAYAIARGYMRSGQGNPDEARSARYILKDYVNAKLLFCHPPPGISADNFNQETHKNALARVAGKKRAPVTRVGKDADTFIPMDIPATTTSETSGIKTHTLDQEFFTEKSRANAAFVAGREYTRSKSYPHQNRLADDGTPIGANNARLASVLASQEVGFSGKKHHKKMKRGKQRSGKGYD